MYIRLHAGPSSDLVRFVGVPSTPSIAESLRSESAVDKSKPVTTPCKTVLLTTCRISSSGSRPSASARCMIPSTDAISSDVRCSEAMFWRCCEGGLGCAGVIRAVGGETRVDWR
jgi:hypothetical protein